MQLTGQSTGGQPPTRPARVTHEKVYHAYLSQACVRVYCVLFFARLPEQAPDPRDVQRPGRVYENERAEKRRPRRNF